MEIVDFPKNPKELRRHNLAKYKGVQPSWELVKDVVIRSKLKRLAVFEIIWGLPTDLLTMYKNGRRNLPPKYWHIFYEFDLVNQMYNKLSKKTASSHKKQSILHSNKMILDGISRL